MAKQEQKKLQNELFYVYYERWIKIYKEGAVRKVTMDKYRLALTWLKKLAPNLKTCDLSRTIYQQLLNDYAACHERQTTMDFHHQLKGAILDAVDDGVIKIDPTRKVIIKGKPQRDKKVKYLNQFQAFKHHKRTWIIATNLQTNGMLRTFWTRRISLGKKKKLNNFTSIFYANIVKYIWYRNGPLLLERTKTI